ncbi:hypothetical protein ABMA27_008640 [Loxostege sticticalis]|uniref:SMB domain-containing protein n=1 Tax=Loxostege sticticalis TaxID=481309 RepID=A0ABR3HC98_LOXSC
MLRYWLCFASAVCLAGHCGANYCRDANLCCPGRDSACVVQKAHQNAIIEDLTDKPCYCDHACLKLGDCCPDFRETCGGKQAHGCPKMMTRIIFTRGTLYKVTLATAHAHNRNVPTRLREILPKMGINHASIYGNTTRFVNQCLFLHTTLWNN